MRLNRLLSDYAHDPQGLQKFVGLIAGGGAIVIALFNIDTEMVAFRHNVSRALLHPAVAALFLFGVIGIATGFWKSRIAQLAHVVSFLATAFLAQSEAHPGDLTSALFLIFALVLIVEYGLGPVGVIVWCAVAVIGYPYVMVLGYEQQSKSIFVQTVVELLGVAVFVALYGSIFLKHWLRYREDADLLESRVRERTAELEKSLAERAVMLQEIHHRVKNNLQIVASLLQLEANKLTDERSRQPMEASIQRIHAMALVHQTLYGTTPLESIELGQYIERLVDAIQGVSRAAVHFTFEISGPIVVGLDSAISLGLLLNELLTNSIKHAFPTGGPGNVSVQVNSKDHLQIVVADDGIGIGEGLRLDQTSSLGLTIVTALTQQLRGKISLERLAGTRWTITLPLEHVLKVDY